MSVEYAPRQRLGAEFLGSALLLATVIGSGIMGERLSGRNVAIALLGNTIPTGAILVVLITMLGPISGAHFNPAVTTVFLLKKEIGTAEALAYVLVQTAWGQVWTAGQSCNRSARLVFVKLWNAGHWRLASLHDPGGARALAIALFYTLAAPEVILRTGALRRDAGRFEVRPTQPTGEASGGRTFTPGDESGMLALAGKVEAAKGGRHRAPFKITKMRSP
jgi:hypothetical protein